MNKKSAITSICILAISQFISYSQKNSEPIFMSAVNDFSLTLREGKAPNRLPYNPFHVEKEWNALAGDDLNFAFHMASAEGKFPGKKGTYTVTLNTLTERDGECAYNVYVDDKLIGQCQKNPPTNEFCAPAMLKWSGVEIPENARIRVESNSYSNLRRPEGGFFEYARGRWTGIAFHPEQTKPSSPAPIINPSLFERCMNVGSHETNTEYKFDIPAQSYYLVGGGSGLKENQDSFGYLCKQVNSDFILETGVKLLGISGSRSSATGIMIRKSSNPDAAFISCLIQDDGVLSVKYRAAAGAEIKELSSRTSGAEMIQIERKGDTFTISSAKFGDTYERNNVQIPALRESALIGFFVSSGSDKSKEAAAFSNVRFFEY